MLIENYLKFVLVYYSMVNCQVSKATLRKFEKIQDDVAQLDANYLVGKVGERAYKSKRNLLLKRFDSMKKRLNKC